MGCILTAKMHSLRCRSQNVLKVPVSPGNFGRAALMGPFLTHAFLFRHIFTLKRSGSKFTFRIYIGRQGSREPFATYYGVLGVRKTFGRYCTHKARIFLRIHHSVEDTQKKRTRTQRITKAEKRVRLRACERRAPVCMKERSQTGK